MNSADDCVLSIALANGGASTCVTGDIDEDKTVTVGEIISAVGNLLNRCVPRPTASRRRRA